jgi:hypothetical protein
MGIHVLENLLLPSSRHKRFLFLNYHTISQKSSFTLKMAA